MFDERYDRDVLADMKPRRGPVKRRAVALSKNLVVEHSESEWTGAVIALRDGLVHLEDGRGKVRAFAITDAFLIDGEPVTLEVPRRAAPRARTASGSVSAPLSRARVAVPSRIFVEGRHDAELVEQVWGADLRVEGVVVELLDGADNLEAVLRDFGPSRTQRAGVLLDHLVEGSKETRIAEQIRAASWGEHVLVLGHPFIDIWAAVKPARIGRDAWPHIPRGTDWKTGVCTELGWPAHDQADIAHAWARIRTRVRDYRDLEPALVGRVEELIDFVTAEQQHE